MENEAVFKGQGQVYVDMTTLQDAPKTGEGKITLTLTGKFIGGDLPNGLKDKEASFAVMEMAFHGMGDLASIIQKTGVPSHLIAMRAVSDIMERLSKNENASEVQPSEKYMVAPSAGGLN